jgi:predicted membrane channel-forming protein YqfA (hemolysin III family)
MSMQDKKLERVCHISGWLMFIASAVFFVVSSIRSGDWAALLGALIFLIACFVFLVPFVAHALRSKSSSSR